MRATFLGTSGSVPTTKRNPSAIMVSRAGERLLFDCGEGTQRQMMRFGTGFDVTHLFVTHLHGDHILGIPGLLQTWDFNDREAPLAIHTPAGTGKTLRELTTTGDTTTDYPVRINQVQPDEVVLSAPDYEVRAVEVDHRTTAVGYALVEDERKGRFDRETAEEEFGIPPGPKYSKLHEGEAVEHDGRVIEPEEVVGPPRPGRRLVYTGDTAPTERVVEAARDADLLVHDGTFGTDRADRAAATDHSTARQAAHIATRANVDTLALTHISSRYAGGVGQLAREAAEAFDGRESLIAHDGMAVEIPFPDSDESVTFEDARE